MKPLSKRADSPVIEGNDDQPLTEHDQLPGRADLASGRKEMPSSNGALSGQNGRGINRISIAVWLSAKEAAIKLSCSTDTIERRAIPWQENAVRYKIRFKFLVLDEGAEPTRRYFEPDVEALLVPPNILPMSSRRRLTPKFVPRAAPVS